MQNSYLPSVLKQVNYYKKIGYQTLEKLDDDHIFYKPDSDSNSIAIIVKHVAGNMLSRWTNFLTEDGEKNWRNRDDEFINDFTTKEEVISYWEKGWNCFISALNSLEPQDLEKIIHIRNEGHTITEAINRQLCHYPYHIGQIVFLGKLILKEKWISLSIPKNKSEEYNLHKFNQKKFKKHFTDDQ
ncbi:Protein of unknown function [Tenacibaculum sp. MAR_2009_124]|uniref:DUF1572 family protein n=1 Tax=Tenacibaculum sp. MAR_2009_124 TaxID=1250059 RepID=UPI00089C5993|nr:DUF1572 family protein [Tenacibaculum sp. MAR_2009_124]SEB54493.1 Protein of unknown function [Tenacibaculum sp. MAR_2009_124]